MNDYSLGKLLRCCKICYLTQSNVTVRTWNQGRAYKTKVLGEKIVKTKKKTFINIFFKQNSKFTKFCFMSFRRTRRDDRILSDLTGLQRKKSSDRKGPPPHSA